ncbi:hypothetical protein M426DRAFT_261774 [Hypoxylon sp. CI-4A]|nr:hypothetical protein M426DRAFT_261774 [Hypoxylon sp. CI-4A]
MAPCIHLLLVWTTLLQSVLALPGVVYAPVASNATCRVMPGDLNWPRKYEWTQLNSSVNGRLIATTPEAFVCHDPSFDAETCDTLKSTWSFANPHLTSPIDILAPYFQNQSCDPYTPRDTPCFIGNYAPFSINVSSVSDIQAGLSFARDKNIRLVLKNTGHDILGKSTGKGALSLWLHNLKNIEFFDSYTRGGRYTGPYVRLGAGVIFEEIFSAADARKLRVLTGSCPTVSAGGGFATGGGHSAFTSVYGLAADNILEWEVVTPEGDHLVVTPDDHADLYWALSGGGPGTFAVVVSLTMRVYQDAPMTGAMLSYDNNTAGSNDKFWDSITTFHSTLSSAVDAGATIYYALTATSMTVFNIAIPTVNASVVSKILDPMRSNLAASGIPLNITSSVHSGFLDMYNTYLRPTVAVTPEAQVAGGRLIPRPIIEDQKASEELTSAFREATEAGFNLICTVLSANKKPPYDNSVLPAWRSALMTCLVQVPWDFEGPWSEMLEKQDVLTRSVMPQIEAATPNAGAYLNEASFLQSDWQQVFYGSNYPRLSAIKAKYDPDSLLYATTAVGSESWISNQDGRLCRG